MSSNLIANPAQFDTGKFLFRQKALHAKSNLSMINFNCSTTIFGKNETSGFVASYKNQKASVLYSLSNLLQLQLANIFRHRHFLNLDDARTRIM